ncbi:MAG: SIS domain-containing protein, partial [Aquihabitans sp.]
GRLGALADDLAAPTVFLPIAETPVPTRARIGALAVPVLRAFEQMGLSPGASDWIGAAVQQLQTRRDELDAADNVAAALARRVAGTMPIVYGGNAIGRVAADRWKVQINQSAKTPCWVGELPDVVHGEIAGWGQHGDITRQVMSLIMLRHDFEPPAVVEQFALVEEWTEEVMAGIHTVSAAGEGSLAQILDLGFFGDVLALELADRAGIDPGPTPTIAASPAAPATPKV